MLSDRKEGFSTTFWQDFSIADRFGPSAVRDTFDRAFREWRSDYLYLTDLVAVLNHKMWQHHAAGHEVMTSLYQRLYCEAESYGSDHLRGEELEYFWRVLD